MLILAIDPGSSATGAAIWRNGVLVSMSHYAPTRGTWRERLEQICDGLTHDHAWHPGQPLPVIAIEETVAFRATLNVGFVLARGYLLRFLTAELVPGAEVLEVPIATVKHSLGLKGNAKRAERIAAARERFPMAATEDEADAAAVGLAAASIIAERIAQAG